MEIPKIIRVGICACAPELRGILGGIVLRVGNEEFRIEEYTIPEHEQEQARTCHAFLDGHLDVVQLDFIRAGRERNREMIGIWEKRPDAQALLDALSRPFENMSLEEASQYFRRTLVL